MSKRRDPAQTRLDAFNRAAVAAGLPFEVVVDVTQRILDGEFDDLAATRRAIVEQAARDVFVDAWTSREEYAERDASPENAPRTSAAARRAVREWVGRVEASAGMPIELLYVVAAHAPGKHYAPPYPEEFGYALAMEALGHGVTWDDNHPPIRVRGARWKPPDLEFYL